MHSLVHLTALATLLGAAPAAAQLGDAAPDFVVLADAEGDGIVSQDEFTAYYALIWEIVAPGKVEVDVQKANPLLRAMILGALPNASGTVNRYQLLDVTPARYRDADKDRDGTLTMAEMRAWKASAMTPKPS